MMTLESRLNLAMWVGIIIATIGGMSGTMWAVYLGAVIIVVLALCRRSLWWQVKRANQ